MVSVPHHLAPCHRVAGPLPDGRRRAQMPVQRVQIPAPIADFGNIGIDQPFAGLRCEIEAMGPGAGTKGERRGEDVNQ